MTLLPPRPAASWRTAALLAAALLAALAANNFHYLFRSDLYEFEDLAVNSLQITRAKHFGEIYGQYSRWGFHHPGPAFFYVQAWGEQLFHDWLHIAPQPLNAQILATAALNAFFLGAALATAARQVGPRTAFLPLALLLGVLHVAAIHFMNVPLGCLLLLGNWPGFFLVVPFAALLIALASVAAGRGESLPLAALAGGFLAHGHVTQPVLFVLPLSALAYAGLILACPEPGGPGSNGSPGGLARRVRAALARPWRRFPRAHWAALLLVAGFLLPLALDLARGGGSNAARILRFRQTHAGEPHKTLARSLLYFVQFGLYQFYSPDQDYLGRYTAAGAWSYLQANRSVGEGWLAALLGSGAAMLSWRRVAARPAGRAEMPPEVLARRRFAVWLWVFVGAATALALVWGCVMDGQMVYYNAFINYAIFYVGMLAAAAVATDALAPADTRGLRCSLYAALLLAGLLNADRFRLTDYARDAAVRQTAQTVAAALRAVPGRAPARRCRLEFAGGDWTLAVRVALLLERQGGSYLAPPGWDIVFGEDRCPADPAAGGQPFSVWKIAAASAVPADATALPLDGGRVLLTGGGKIDPAANAEIRFAGEAANTAGYALLGWGSPEAGNAPFLWSSSPVAVLSFRPAPVPPGSTVHLVFDCFPFLAPGRLPAQRLELSFNGAALGSWPRTSDEPLDVAVPAAAWNARPDAALVLRFPDAASPAQLGLSGDTRLLAFGFRRIGFRVEPGPAAPPGG